MSQVQETKRKVRERKVHYSGHLRMASIFQGVIIVLKLSFYGI
ncbi:MAG: hypothetical protein JPMHGGIA_02836 [Saprospiraceae bacterium]|nr:hypothetical protein [Saprospiraceae bacterium]